MLKIEEPHTSRRASLAAFMRTHEAIICFVGIGLILVLAAMSLVPQYSEACYDYREVVAMPGDGWDSLIDREVEIGSGLDPRGVREAIEAKNGNVELKSGALILAPTFCDQTGRQGQTGD